MAALLCLLAVPAAVHAEYTIETVTEGEAYAFLWESYLADQRCDDRWHEQHTDPSFTLTTTVDGGPAEIVNLDEWLRVYREQCRFYMRQPFSKSGWSVSAGPYGTTVRLAVETEEANVPALIWAPGKPGSGEAVMTLIKVGGVVKVRDIQRTFTLDKQEGASR